MNPAFLKLIYLTTKCTTLENSGTSTIITPALLATPYPQGGAQTQKSPLGDLGVSYIVGHKGKHKEHKGVEYEYSLI